MKIVFMGTPEYAVPTLRALARHHSVSLVLTRKDAVSKRGNKRTPSPIKACALELGLEVLTPSTLKESEIQSTIAEQRPDVIVVAAYGMILPQSVLDIPPYGCFNLHASLLPRWRGAAPIQRAILAGDTQVGVCLMKMEEGLDTGDFALCQTLEVGDSSAPELTVKLGELAADIILIGLAQLEKGCLVWHTQDESQVTYAHKVTKTDVALNPELSAHTFVARVKASSPSAPSKLELAGKPLTVIDACIFQPQEIQNRDDKLARGEVLITKKHVILGTAEGAVELLMVRPDGKNDMRALDFAHGIQRDANLSWREQ